MNEKLRTSRALTERRSSSADGDWLRCDWISYEAIFSVFPRPPNDRRKAKDEYLECRCLSHRFIFIHFTNTRERRSGQARSRARAEASNVDRLALAISIFSRSTLRRILLLYISRTIANWTIFYCPCRWPPRWLEDAFRPLIFQQRPPCHSIAIQSRQ
jgi:hypothetical protein